MTQPPVENLGERMRTEETMETGETGNGAPTHMMPESCQYWDYTNNLFYISLGGGIWQLVGGAGGGVPSGIIAMWSGAIVNIPVGWTLCDGTAGAPDLRDRFIVGAGAAYVVGATGGAATNNLAHTHGFGTLTTVNDTHSHAAGTLAADNDTHGHAAGTLAADNDTHSHNINITTYANPGAGVTVFSTATATDNDTHNHTVSGNTANDTHNHTVSGNTANDTHNHALAGATSSAGSAVQENRPPYYALAFIMRL